MDDADIVVGAIFDRGLDGKFRVSVVATGLDGGEAGVAPGSPADMQAFQRTLQ
jgi:cell division protein FtsZ